MQNMVWLYGNRCNHHCEGGKKQVKSSSEASGGSRARSALKANSSMTNQESGQIVQIETVKVIGEIAAKESIGRQKGPVPFSSESSTCR